MKATLKLEDGREIAVDVSEETLKQIKKPVKKTGYERVDGQDIYYSVLNDNSIMAYMHHNGKFADLVYENANYYSSKTVAEHQAKADKLHRTLRRFAVEHRERAFDWGNSAQPKYFIYYDSSEKDFFTDSRYAMKAFGAISFDTREIALAAIEEFKDELIWYFTEYKDSL